MSGDISEGSVSLPKAGSSGLPNRGYIARSVIINGLCPLIIYQVASKHMFAGSAILISTLPSVIANVVSIIRTRRADALGVIVLIGLGAGLLLYLLGGPPQLILVRDKLITGAIGLVFLGSLLLPRPLVFYIAREMVAGHDKEKIAQWDGRYEKSKFKFGVATMTIAWGVALILEATLQIALAFVLAIPVYLIFAPIVSIAVYAGMLAWSFRFGRQIRAREMSYSQAS